VQAFSAEDAQRVVELGRTRPWEFAGTRVSVEPIGPVMELYVPKG
jgi:hypothetical protein